MTDLRLAMWTVDTRDWEVIQTDAILQHFKEEDKPGAILLMHDIHQSCVNALPAVMDYLVFEGYQFKTLKEIEEQKK